MKLKLISHFSFALICLGAQTSFGAACCGGGFAAPSIIAGDDKAQLTSSYSTTEVIVDNVDSQGIWRKSDIHQKVQTFRIEGAHIFEDRWQAGFAMPIIQRSRQSENYSGLGDVALSLGYEYLPDWNYSPYRPKGIGFLQLTLPTGKSKADSDVGGLDSRGNGFWAIGVGTLLTKALGRWDVFSSLEIHRSFEKDVNNSNFDGTLKPGYGGNLGAGFGYNLKDYRLGSGITWTYEDPVNSTSNVLGSTQNGAVERYATAVASVSYLASDEWSGTMSYSDQTLFGSPVNTSLGRGIALQVQRRWGR
jgi:hypothetical protein